MTTQEFVQAALLAYGQAIRGDWSSIDGRVIRINLESIAELLDKDAPPEDFDDWVSLELGIIKSKYGSYEWCYESNY